MHLTYAFSCLVARGMRISSPILSSALLSFAYRFQAGMSNPTPRTRVVMHCDMDSFYAQVERERFPHWRHDAIAVVQNGSLCVTTNYHSRARGVPKTAHVDVVHAACPSIRFAGSNMPVRCVLRILVADFAQNSVTAQRARRGARRLRASAAS